MIEVRMREAGICNREAYMRKMALSGYIIRLDLAEAREVISLLGRSAGNMNQIARRVNSMNSIYEADVRDLQENYEQLLVKARVLFKKLAEL